MRSREAPCPSTLALGGPWESSPVCAGAQGQGRRPGQGHEPGSYAGIWSPPLGGGWGPATQLSAGGQRVGWGGHFRAVPVPRVTGVPPKSCGVGLCPKTAGLGPIGTCTPLPRSPAPRLAPAAPRSWEPPIEWESPWRAQRRALGVCPSGKVHGAQEEALLGHAVSLVPALATCIPEGPWPPAAAGSSPWEPGLGLGSALPLRLPDFPGCGRLRRDGFCWLRAF